VVARARKTSLSLAPPFTNCEVVTVPPQDVATTAGAPLGVALGSPILSQCSVKITGFSGTTVSTAYSGLPGNQPHSYDNVLSLWDGTIIPWNVPPTKQLQIAENVETGTEVLDGVRITQSSYTVGYGVGPKVSDICAIATLAAGGQITPPSAVTIGVGTIGTTSLVVHYQTLAGYLPKTSGNWIGLWTGQVSPYNAPDALATVLIPDDENAGDVGINDIILTIDTTYTVIYFVGAPLTTAAALLQFDTGTKTHE